jgi:hypothetical protein
MLFLNYYLDNSYYYYSYQLLNYSFLINNSYNNYIYNLNYLNNFFCINFLFNIAAESSFYDYSYYNLGYKLLPFLGFHFNFTDYNNFLLVSNGIPYGYWIKDDDKDEEILNTLTTGYPLNNFYWFSFFSDFFLDYKKFFLLFPKNSNYKISQNLYSNYLSNSFDGYYFNELSDYRLVLRYTSSGRYFDIFYKNFLENTIKILKLSLFYETIPALDLNFFIERGFLPPYMYSHEN